MVEHLAARAPPGRRLGARLRHRASTRACSGAGAALMLTAVVVGLSLGHPDRLPADAGLRRHDGAADRPAHAHVPDGHRRARRGRRVLAERRLLQHAVQGPALGLCSARRSWRSSAPRTARRFAGSPDPGATLHEPRRGRRPSPRRASCRCPSRTAIRRRRRCGPTPWPRSTNARASPAASSPPCRRASGCRSGSSATQKTMRDSQERFFKAIEGQDLFVPEGSVSAVTTSITKLNEDFIAAQARRIGLEAALKQAAEMRRRGVQARHAAAGGAGQPGRRASTARSAPSTSS